MELEEKNILVVDDEEKIVNVLKAYLEKEGSNVYISNNGEEALDIFNREDIDFIVLDLMMPKLSGEEVCKKIRIKSTVPILMLTAKVEEGDRLTGFDIGADDYVTKPFSPKEIIARIKAIMRRGTKNSIKFNTLEFNKGDLIIEIDRRIVKKNSENIKLTPTEYDILILLGQNPQKVYTREELVTKILGFDYDGYDRTIDVHIKNIRQKIDDNRYKYIVTVYGVGYKFIGG